MPKQTDSIELTNSLQGTVEYTASQEIIPEEKILQQGSFTYTSNGERTENPSEGYDGFSQVAVNVNVQPTLQSKSVSYTENNDYTVEPDDGYQGLSSVAVNVNVPQGGTEAPENDVEFIDYDGTIVYSYTAQEFLALDAMPANPTHEGLTAQGWNWSLADAKEYVGDCGGLVIGQMYITDDGKTRIYITISGHRSPYLHFTRTKPTVIDWGDGNTETVAATAEYSGNSVQHTYSADGDYIISINPTDGGTIGFNAFSLNNAVSGIMCNNQTTPAANVVYYQTVNKIEIGNNVYIASAAFRSLFNLKSISIPSGTKFMDTNNGTMSYTFAETTSLQGVVFPTQIGANKISFRIFSFSNVRRISFPSDFNTYELRSWFEYTRCLNKVFLPSASQTISDSAQYAFVTYDYYYSALKRIAIPEGYTTLGNNFVYNQLGLIDVTIPSTITSIAAGVLYGCRSLSWIKFKSSIPPTVSASSSFQNIPTDCVIYVPYSEDHSVLNAYKTATNYPNPSTYTYVEY